ncbi:hypothetical protein [Bradyrhizobium diazoefficiens]
MARLRSAIHYPHSRISSASTMKQALLLWDEYHLIAPWEDFDPEHEGEIAEAWSIIGKITVPDPVEQRRAHADIVTFIENREQLSRRFFVNADRASRQDVYEVYPTKLLEETWNKLERAGLAGDLLPNADRPMSTWGGLVIMAKLADACAGDIFARVTDRTDAYRAIANEMPKSGVRRQEAPSTIPVLLSIIDAQSIPLENIMRFRSDERDPTLRHNLLDAVQDHIDRLRELESPNQIRAVQDDFDRQMRKNLNDLRDALRYNKIKFVTSAAALTVATGAFAAAAALQTGPLQLGSAISAAASAGLGVKQLADFFGGGLDLSERQRNTMLKHPMAYMHLLSKQRLST